ncbi:MAG: extracellular solute-binding protein [Oscillospiraceae bacterium]|nr:extracellular solute-binding protein [Oscillospiraceae bacterium]
MKNAKKILFVCFLVFVLLFLSSCFSPASTQSSAPESSASSYAPTTETPVSESVISPSGSLIIWDGRTDGDGYILYQSFADDFATEKGVEVDRVTIDLDNLRNILSPAINSGEGPDVISYDPGPGYLGVMARSGLALDLTEQARERGWYERHMDWTLDQCTFDGNLYGIGNQVEANGIFYNKALFAEYNVEVPKTYEEFLSVCEVFKEAGVTPVMLDTLTRWPGFLLESIWLNAYVGPQKMQDVLQIRAQWDQPEFADAMDSLYSLVTMGFAPSNPNAISKDDGDNQFVSGQVAMRPTGAFMIGTFSDPESSPISEDIGFFFLPGPGNMGITPPGGIGEALFISNKGGDAGLALDYLDFLFTGERIQRWCEYSFIPSVEGLDVSAYNLKPLFRNFTEELLGSANMGFNIDVLMPENVNDVTLDIMQELLAGRIDGESYMVEKQKAFQKDIDEGNYVAMS